MLKIHFCWPFNEPIFGESFEFYNSLKTRNDIILVESFDKADFIIYMMDIRNVHNLSDRYTNLNKKIVEKIKSHNDYCKDIIIDYNDHTDLRNVDKSILDKIFLYFKRSVINKSEMKLIKYSRKIHTIAYALRNDFIKYDELIGKIIYEYDVCCMFNVSDIPKSNREKVANLVKEISCKKHVGFVDGSVYNFRYDKVNESYYNIMKKSKIIVTANPPKWEGDYRLWEALLTGNLVLCDKMISVTKLIPNVLENKKHLVFYDDMEHLKKLIKYYLKNENERINIGKNGREYVLKFHKFSDRVDEVIKRIHKNK